MEIHDAVELHRVLTTPQRGDKRFASRWAWWAPGDSTRYRVLHVVAYPVDFAPHERMNHFLMFSTGVDTLAIGRPSRPQNGWNAERFLAEFGERYVGWWAGVRPALAAFKWTDEQVSNVTYDPRDADEIGRLLTES